MYLFDENQRLAKYNDIYAIIERYYPIRYKGYVDRKQHLIDSLSKELVKISNKARFIKENCENIVYVKFMTLTESSVQKTYTPMMRAWFNRLGL